MSKLEELLSKEMTRQQFLMTIGLGVASLFGLSTIMGILTNNDSKPANNHPVGYGDQSYGP